MTSHIPGARPWARAAGALVLVIALSGCGSGLNPVEGQVVWKDGTPAKELEGTLVLFDLPEKKTNANGVVQADGTFKLTTVNKDDGALAGDYKVVLSERRKAAGGPDPSLMAPALMDVRYMNAATTDLQVTIQPGVNKVVLKVDRAARR